MSTRTLRLAGLLEGRMPPTPDFPERLRQFERDARAAGLHLTLELDGGRFGLLGDDVLHELPELTPDPEEALDRQLESLVRAFPEADRAPLFSTLRVTTTAGTARTRTLFALRPDGTVERASERDVIDAPVLPSNPPSSRRAWIPVALVAALLGVLFATDLGGLRSSLTARAPGLEWTVREFDTTDFAGVLEPGGFTLQPLPASVVLHLERGPLFPAADREALLASPDEPGSAAERLIREALLRGEARLVARDAGGTRLETVSIGIDGLFEAERIEVLLPHERLRGATHLKLTF